MNIRLIQSFVLLLVSFNLSAAILDKDEVDNADLAMLQNETAVFQSIGMGIALSIAQCEGVELCSLTVEENEIKKLLDTLDERIENLTLKQEEAEDPVAFDKVLTAYVNERESYTSHLEKLQNLGNTVATDDELPEETFEFETEEVEDFPVESAQNEELIDYLNELEAFEDDELEDDEDLEDLPDLPELE
ncbi:MAG: hypothetical protein AAF419_03485 [Pseudomonadota bacterium]